MKKFTSRENKAAIFLLGPIRLFLLIFLIDEPSVKTMLELIANMREGQLRKLVRQGYQPVSQA